MNEFDLQQKGWVKQPDGSWSYPKFYSQLPAAEPERVAQLPLVSAPPRENAGAARFEICFTVYALRPLDWDNWWFKGMQDALIQAGILTSDAAGALQGRVISHQVHSKAEERTEIEIVNL